MLNFSINILFKYVLDITKKRIFLQ